MATRDSTSEQDNLAMSVIHAILWTALIVAPAFLGVLATVFVVRAFSGGFLPGLRSFASILLPLVVLTFVVAPQFAQNQQGAATRDKKEPPRREAKLSLWQATALMAAAGALMMQLLKLSTSIPIVELVLATGFAFILYLWADSKDHAAPYCLGLVIGALGYIVIVGVPHV